MSITQRILESAQSQWSKLTSLVIVDEEPLSHIDGSALQAELTARKAGRSTARKPSENPIAKMAGAGEAARTAREKAATARRARVVRERDERAAKQKAANDDAFRRMKDEARTSGNTGNFGGSARSSNTSTGSARSPRPGSSEAQLQEWQKTLGVQPGSDLAQIKSAYRQLMRKYHPDMHAGNPQKEKAATELSLKVTSAYNGLMAHLEKHK